MLSRLFDHFCPKPSFLFALVLLLMATPSASAQGSGPVFSQPNYMGICCASNAQINVTYGNSALVPATATFTPAYAGSGQITSGFWEIVAIDTTGGFSCPGHIKPMPAWISFRPSSGPLGTFQNIKMTIDPTKGGGTVLLAAVFSPYDNYDYFTTCPPNGGTTLFAGMGWGNEVDWIDQNGKIFGAFANQTNFAANPWGMGTWYVTTDTAGTDQGTTGLDLGPSCPRAGAENMCGSPINLTNGNTWVHASDYALPGIGGGIPLARTWNSEWLNNSPFIQAGMFGESWQSTYEKRMQIVAGGTQIRYWRGDGSAWLFSIGKSSYSLISPPDERATLTYSKSSGYTVTLRDGSQELYNTNGYLLSLADRNGNKATLTYDGSNRVTKVTDAAARILQFNYDPVFIQQIKSIQDAVGTIATFSYDSNSRLLSVTHADNSVINYNYDANGLLLSVLDQLGKVLESHTYDSRRRGLSSSKANGVDSLTIAYSPGGGSATLTDSQGNVTIYFSGDQFGSRRYLNSVGGTGCDSCVGRNTQQFSYDTSGNRTSSTDPNNNVANYSYDSNGNVTQVSRPSSSGTQAWQYTWNSFGEPLTTTDPLGKVTTNTYDTKGNLLTTKTPLGNTTTFTYDTKGELLTIKDPRLNVTTLTYTTAGLLASIKDAQNNVTQFQYDARVNRTAVIDPLNQTTSYTFDNMNRLTKITYPTSPATSVQFAYDYRGRRTPVTDANSKITTYGYDDADRLVSVTDANTQVTGYVYDSENNLTQITDAAANKTSFVYDNLGRLKQTTFPSTLVETYGYDSNGNLSGKTDRNGHSISYTYTS
jgi:YD repeat-containing protein